MGSGLRHNAYPTQFTELNELLRDLTRSAAGILGDNFVGAYLQGSFAVGDADRYSDCDFLIPVNGPIRPEQEAALRTLHDEIPTRPGHWTRHLEGSYPDREELRTLDGLGRPWLYIDHGWRRMQWSTHCNTEVVRWSLRECGVTLTGPDPRTLVEPVPPEALRARMRRNARTFLADLQSWTSLDLGWSQRYAVTTLCRILQTYDEARVASKKAALLWAADHVDARWEPLVRRALEGRALGWDPHERATPDSVELTLAFQEYVQRWTGAQPGAPA